MNQRVFYPLRRRQGVRAFTTVLALALAATLLAACGGDTASTATSVASAATTQPASGATATGVSSPSAPTAPAATARATTPAVATSTPPTAVSSPSATSSGSGSGETLTLRVYFLRGEHIASMQRTVPQTLQVAAAALGELLKGPVAQDGSGVSTAVPSGTTYISTAIEGGTATVNLSGDFAAGGGSASMHARLAQVVYTLTQFPSISAVQFALDGQIVDVFGSEGLILDHPQTRADYEDITPAILLESPTPGGSATGATLRITGTANTFEATFNAKVTDANGQVLAQQVVTATSGSGTRGTFDATLIFAPAPTPASQGTLTVYESSAKDGSPQNVIEIPVTFGN